MEKKVDVAIIGAGSAGISALSEIKKKTENFVIINEGPYGTTCARVACMPSKALIEVANAYHRRQTFSSMGINGTEGLRADIPSVLKHVRKLRDEFVSGMKAVTDRLGEQSISGKAVFLEPDLLEVNGQKIKARRIVIATGSRPVIPEEWKKLGDRILTNENLFDQKDLPSRIAVIGLGGTGLELGQALSRLGIEISSFEKSSSLGGLSDIKVKECFHESISQEFPIYIQNSIRIAAEDKGVRITAGEKSIFADKILASIGRRPNIDGLGLNRLGIEMDEQGIPQFNPTSMQVNDCPIFIAGDANGQRVLLHEAVDEGRIAGFNAVRETNQCFERRIPFSIIFSDPEIILLGQRPYNLSDGYVTGEADFSKQSRAQMAGRNRGCLSVYADKKEGSLLGAEMAVSDGEHLGQFLATAVQRRMTVFDLLKIPFYHPVIEEGLQSALKHASKQLKGPSAAEMLLCESTPEEPVC